MEQELADGMFWLPPEFLNDDDDVFMNSGVSTGNLSSPVESVIGSTETESDEEDYLSELSRKLAQSTLEDNFWKMESSYSKSTTVMAGSPQSTLCGCKQISSRGSSNCPSPAPVPAGSRNDAPYDVLYRAAGEVARIRMTEESGYRNHVAQQPQPPRRIPSPNPQFHQIQAAQMKQQQLQQKQHEQYKQFVKQSIGRNGGGGNMKTVPPPPLSAWPTLQQSRQQQPPPPPPPASRSGMRAVFLGNPNPKRESTGTGVFLPRQIGAPTETRKKRGCSTVLLPEKVVHALNLNLEAQIRSNYDYNAEMRYRSNVLVAEQRRQQVEKDLRLPQEWTY